MNNYQYPLKNGRSDSSKNHFDVASDFINAIDPFVACANDCTAHFDAKKRRFSRLTFNISKSYVKNKLNEIRLYGSREADKLMERLTPQPKSSADVIIQNAIKINRGRIKRLLCEIASECDADAVSGFFVPFIYGGIVSCKSSTGETTLFVDFSPRNRDSGPNDLKKSILRASGAIFRAKHKGISVISVRGSRDEIFSAEMCRAYADSPEQAFILVERCGSVTVESGDIAYDKGITDRLRQLKNIFVLIESDGGGSCGLEGSNLKNAMESNKKDVSFQSLAVAKLKALKCYKILSGLIETEGGSCRKGECSNLYSSDRIECLIFNDSLSITEFLSQNGVDIPSFMKKISFDEYKSADPSYKRNMAYAQKRNGREAVVDGLPIGELTDLVKKMSDKTGALLDKKAVLPNLFEILTVIQYISSGGRHRNLTIERI